MHTTERGSILEPLMVLLALVLIIIFYIVPNGKSAGPVISSQSSGLAEGGTLSSGSGTSAASGPVVAASAYADSLSLSQGNAEYEIQPAQEYITLDNRGDSPINITGWKLTNNKSNRVYYVGNNAVHYASDTAIIPQAAGYISPNGFNLPQNVVLKPNDTAIITTGSVGVTAPYKIVSFKENECSGYLEDLPQYDFTPSLSYSCVNPSDEPGLAALGTDCRDFVEGLSSCQTPTFGKIDHSSSDNCDNCVNGEPAPSSACFNFIKAHFSYEGCINYHKNDPDFYGTTWRIFLGEPWELWGQEDEVISLFDQFGHLVTSQSY